MYCTGASVSGAVAAAVLGATVSGAAIFGAEGLIGWIRVPDTGATRVRAGIDLARAGWARAMRPVRPPETATDTATTARVSDDTLCTARSRSRLALVVLMQPRSAPPH